ncbi:YHS domain-containing (seleno)protein [Elongatibacter sediminis]|uniref:YHS domain-containing (Seleno)protein n=1 Tax=Elongatibacter sediminis TaxID=3119006 RepID=A0AAW9RHC2_9GAMM
MKHHFIATALVLFSAVFQQAAFAADEHNVSAGLTYTGKPLALHGFDPVAFVDIGNRIEGFATHSAVHEGVAYYFASAENKKTFEKSPGRYAPQFGGFCAFGVSVAKKFDGDPRYAAVEDGKLYVFLNEAVLKEFHKDRAGTIAKAEKNWKKIRSKTAASL